MKKIRRYLGVPIAVWLIVALAGTAFAWYHFNSISSTTKVEEPLSTTETAEFSETMHPGDTNTWEWNIVNSANIEYSIKADLTFEAPDGVSIDSFKVKNQDKTSDLTDDGSAEFTIHKGTTHCCLTISAVKDAAPGEVSVSLDLSRA